MEQDNAFLGGVISLGKAFIAVGLPVVIVNSGNLLFHRIAPHGFFATPIFVALARTVGLLVGLLTLHASFDPGHYSLEELFVPSSPWNLSFGQFLSEHANPFSFRLFPVEDGVSVWRAALMVLIVALMATIILLAFRLWPQPPLRTIGVCAGIAALTVWSMVYLVSLALWSLHVLNFWSFALIGFYYHYRTSRH